MQEEQTGLGVDPSAAGSSTKKPISDLAFMTAPNMKILGYALHKVGK